MAPSTCPHCNSADILRISLISEANARWVCAGCNASGVISPAGSTTICTTHRSQPGAARLSRSTFLAAFDAVAAIGRSVCQPGAVGGLYGQHGRTVRLAESVKEFSDVCREVGTDLMDGSINDNELQRIDRECGELIASVHALRESLARRNREGKRP